MKLLQVIEKDSSGIVRLQIKLGWFSRPEWVFGFELDKYYNLNWSKVGDEGLHFRSAIDGKLHKWSFTINNLYCAWIKTHREKIEAEAALNKFLEIDDVLALPSHNNVDQDKMISCSTQSQELCTQCLFDKRNFVKC